MALDLWCLFLTVLLLALLVPGPDMLVVIYWRLMKGRWAGIQAALGVSASSCLQASVTAFGLSALLHTYPFLFSTLKFAGAIYLMYTGFSMIKGAHASQTWTESGEKKPFIQAFFTNVLNPKAFLFFQALLPQFINFNAEKSVTTQFIVLGYSASMLALVYYLILIEIVGMLSQKTLTRNGSKPLLHWLAGLLLIALGAGLLFHVQHSTTSSGSFVDEWDSKKHL